MSKFKVGDIVYLPAIIETINEDSDISHRVVFGDGEMEWFDKQFLIPKEDVIVIDRKTTISKMEKFQSKWFEVENVEGEKRIINIDKIIALSDKTECVTLEDCYQYGLTTESYNKLKERLLNEI